MDLINIHDGAGIFFACVVATALLIFWRKPGERRLLAALISIFTAAFIVMYFTAGPSGGLDLSKESLAYRFAAYCLVFSLISLSGVTFFRALVPAVGLSAPRILQDVVVAAAYIVWTLFFLSAVGSNPSNILATSTVLTAVIGFSMQDTLGNILAGLAIQIDQSIHKGDWIKIDDLVGRVTETRWRYTSIETRNWETVLIPNSVLMKNKFLVLGRRTGEPVQWRRWVYFNVDFRTSPKKVIDTVVEAVRTAEIPRVSKKPEPSCVCMDFTESYGRYAVRYWLTDLAVDDPTDSEVRTHVFAALQRAGIPLSIPAHAVFLTQETAERKTSKATQMVALRHAALQHVELFRALNPEELDQLAGHLIPAPFAKGDAMTQQGAAAHWLYIIVEGHADVMLTKDGETMKLSELGPGSVFGEMGLMTGEPRATTVIATSDVDCYRLDKESFSQIIKTRPELAEGFSHILAKRRADIDLALGHINADMRAKQNSQQDILGKIRNFFGV